jgi:hypothetical protein
MFLPLPWTDPNHPASLLVNCLQTELSLLLLHPILVPSTLFRKQMSLFCFYCHHECKFLFVNCEKSTPLMMLPQQKLHWLAMKLMFKPPCKVWPPLLLVLYSKSSLLQLKTLAAWWLIGFITHLRGGYKWTQSSNRIMIGKRKSKYLEKNLPHGIIGTWIQAFMVSRKRLNHLGYSMAQCVQWLRLLTITSTAKLGWLYEGLEFTFLPQKYTYSPMMVRSSQRLFTCPQVHGLFNTEIKN